MWYFTCFLLWKRESACSISWYKCTTEKYIKQSSGRKWMTYWLLFFVLHTGEILAQVPEGADLWLNAYQIQTGSQTNWVSSILVHHFQGNDFGSDLIFLKDGERDHPYGYDWPEKNALFPCIFTGFYSEKSHDECLWPTQTCEFGSNEPSERWGLGHLFFGVSAHGALPTTIHGRLFWKTQRDPEGHGASLALCPPASRRPDAEASPRNHTGSAGWSWCPVGPESSPQVSPNQVAW